MYLGLLENKNKTKSNAGFHIHLVKHCFKDLLQPMFFNNTLRKAETKNCCKEPFNLTNLT